MEPEIIETVITEMLGEIKRSIDLNKENYEVVLENKNRLISLEKKLGSRSEINPIIDHTSIEQIISAGINNISSIIEQRPQKVRREFRILLFPERNTTEYYKVVFGRIIFWLVMLVIVKYLYLLGNEWITREYQDHRYKNVWENLYKQQRKPVQIMMQKIIDKE